MKKVVALLLAALMVLSLAACGSSGGASAISDEKKEVAEGVENYKIGVSILELTAYTWYQGVIDGCKQWVEENGEKNGVNFEFTFEDSHSDVQTMLTKVENMLAAGAQGIILFPADESSAIPTMKEYTAKGIPFVIGDWPQEYTDPADKVWATYVGHDMRALGEVAGQIAVDYLKTLNTDKPVCVFISVPAQGQPTIERFEGYRDTILASFPNAVILEEGDIGGNTRDSSQTLFENVLQREDHIDVVSGHNDAAVVGAYNAAVAQGRTDPKFIGLAGDIDVLGWLESKNEAWIGEVLQDPCVLGYQATDALYRTLIKHEELPDNYELPQPEAITPENISEYDWHSWGWLG